MDCASVNVSMLPLSMAAPWNSGHESGEVRWLAMETPPALQPWIITRVASPPNARMLSRTHAIAALWSCTP